MPRQPRRRPRDIAGWPDRAAVPVFERETIEGEAVIELLDWLDTTSQLMADRQMTQQQLADTSGIGLRTINRVFAGDAWPELPTIVAIDRTLASPADELLTIEDRWRAICHHCDDTLRTPLALTPPTAVEAYTVVTERHGHIWTGMRCLWADLLLDHGHEPGWPPDPHDHLDLGDLWRLPHLEDATTTEHR